MAGTGKCFGLILSSFIPAVAIQDNAYSSHDSTQHSVGIRKKDNSNKFVGFALSLNHYLPYYNLVTYVTVSQAQGV